MGSTFWHLVAKIGRTKTVTGRQTPRFITYVKFSDFAKPLALSQELHLCENCNFIRESARKTVRRKLRPTNFKINHHSSAVKIVNVTLY